MKYSAYIIKRKIEDFFILPFVVLGRLIAKIKKQSKEYDIYFFYPFYHTGGAEKVHSLISNALGSNNCIIYFTRKSVDDNFLKDFQKSGCKLIDISGFTDNKYLYFLNIIFRGILSGYINNQSKQPIIFNGQCNFGYKIAPWLNTSIPQVELIHSYNTFSWIRLPFLPFIAKTVMISKMRIEDHIKQYELLHVPKDYHNKIQYIVNGIPLPKSIQQKPVDGSLNILYVGRGTEEKRVHLIAQMAKEAEQKSLPVKFQFMGDVEYAIPSELKIYCSFLGHQSDQKVIDAIYQKAHVVIITSYTEGFPMVIEEGMARGCAVIATPVGDIPVHVKNNENGFLFSTVANEKTIVQEGVEFILLLCNNRELLATFECNNIKYANEHFSIETFNQAYQQLFHQLSTVS